MDLRVDDEPTMTTSRGTAKNARTCVGCGAKTAAPSAFVRLVLGPGGVVAVDATGGSFGRGAHVHPTPECLAEAARKGIARAAKARVMLSPADGGEPVPLTVESLSASVERAALARVGALLSAAARAKAVMVGADSVTGACQRGEAQLVVVATDAAAAADLGEVRRAVAQGRAVAWGDKASLGATCGKSGRDGVGVIAITSVGLARAVRDAMAVVDAARAAPTARSGRRSGADRGGATGNVRGGAEPPQRRDHGSRPRERTN